MFCVFVHSWLNSFHLKDIFHSHNNIVQLKYVYVKQHKTSSTLIVTCESQNYSPLFNARI